MGLYCNIDSRTYDSSAHLSGAGWKRNDQLPTQRRGRDGELSKNSRNMKTATNRAA